MKRNFSSNTRNGSAGFTLIELLVVIAIIALITSLILAVMNNTRTNARDAKKLANALQLSKAIALYFQATGNMPLASKTNKRPTDFYNGTQYYSASAYNTDLGVGSPGFYQWSDFLAELAPYLNAPASTFQVSNKSYDFSYTGYFDSNNQAALYYWKNNGNGSCSYNPFAPGAPTYGFIFSPLENRTGDSPEGLATCFGTQTEVIPLNF